MFVLFFFGDLFVFINKPVSFECGNSVHEVIEDGELYIGVDGGGGVGEGNAVLEGKSGAGPDLAFEALRYRAGEAGPEEAALPGGQHPLVGAGDEGDTLG